MECKLEICVDNQAWDALVSESHQGSVFSMSAFIDSLGCLYERVIISSQDRAMFGALIMKDINGSPLLSPHIFTLYQGVLFSKAYVEMPVHRRVKIGVEIISKFLEFCAKHYSGLSLSLHHSLEDLRAFLWHNYHTVNQPKFHLQLAYTGLIDLVKEKNFEAYLLSIRQVKRQEYKKGVEFVWRESGVEGVDTLANLHMLTFERQGIVYDKEKMRLLKSISSAALANSFGELLISFSKKDEPIAATLFLQDAHTSYYLFGANHPEYRKTGVGTFLTLENIRRAFDKELQAVDMIGINSPGRGDFKTSLNAAPKPYFSATLS